MNYLERKYRSIKYKLKKTSWFRLRVRLYLYWIGGIYYGYTIKPNKHYSLIKHRLFDLFKWLGYKDETNPFRNKSYNPSVIFVTRGWNKLTFNLVKELYKAGWNRQLRDCKSKYGGLRFYTGGMTEKQYSIVSKYESLSYRTCEDCGSTNKVTQTNGWVYTLCEECLEKYKNN